MINKNFILKILLLGLIFLLSQTFLLKSVEANSKIKKSQGIKTERKVPRNEQDNYLDELILVDLQNSYGEKVMKEKGELFIHGGKLRAKWLFKLPENVQKGERFRAEIPNWIIVKESEIGKVKETAEISKDSIEYEVNKEKKFVEVIIKKDTGAVNVMIESASTLNVPDQTAQSPMIRELSYQSMTGKKSYFISLPIKPIQSEESKITFLDGNNQPTNYMPKRARVEVYLNPYQVETEKVILKSEIIKGNTVDIIAVKEMSLEAKVSTFSRYADGRIKEEVESNLTGGITFGRYNNECTIPKAINSIKLVYYVNLSYTVFRPNSFQAPDPKYKFVGHDNINSFGRYYSKDYNNITQNLDEKNIQNFPFKVEKENNLVFLKAKDITYNAVNFYINATKQTLKKGTEIVLTPLDPKAYFNLIYHSEVQEATVEIEPSGEDKAGNYSKSPTWTAKALLGGRQIVVTYNGQNTNRAYALKLPIGISGESDNLRSDFFKPDFYKIETRDAKGKEHVDVREAAFKIDGRQTEIILIEKPSHDNRLKIRIEGNSQLMALKKVEIEFEENPGLPQNLLQNININIVGRKKPGDTSVIKFVEDVHYKVETNGRKLEITYLIDFWDRATVEVDFDFEMSKLPLNNKFTYKTTMFEAKTDSKRWKTKEFKIPVDYIVNEPVFFELPHAELVKETLIQSSYLKVNQSNKKTKQQVFTIGDDEAGAILKPQLSDISIYKMGEDITEFKKIDSLSVYKHQKLQPTDPDYPKIKIEDGKIVIDFKKGIENPYIIGTTFERLDNYYQVPKIPIIGVVFDGQNKELSKIQGVIQKSIYPVLQGKIKTSINNSPNYNNMAILTLEIPAYQDKGWVYKGLEFEQSLEPSVKNQLRYLSELMEIRDKEGNLYPNEKVSIIPQPYDDYNIKFLEDIKKDIIIKIPIVTIFNGKMTVEIEAGSGKIGSLSAKEIIKEGQNKVTLSSASTSGGAEYILTNATINVKDVTTAQGLAKAKFDLINEKTGEISQLNVSNSKGVIELKDKLATNYRLVQTEAPEGYEINPEYAGEGKKITLVREASKNVFEVKLGRKSKLMVHFTYQDGSPIDDIEPLELRPQEQPFNLKANEQIQKVQEKLQENYHLVEFDKGDLEGNEEGLNLSGTNNEVWYRYEGLVVVKAPSRLRFQMGQVSPFTQKLASNNTDAFKVSVVDYRQTNATNQTSSGLTRGHFTIQASQPGEFTKVGNANEKLTNTKMVHVNGNREFPLAGTELINSTQNTSSPNNKSFEFLLDDQTSQLGFRLNVGPGVTKSGKYEGTLSFDFVQGP
ncbi:MSCRAMM family protein [Vagococcus sp.]|uniref:MSCRAMM family protein n=1 Tax=Vagococcus sp. TaxID=1933889 RepID=UPI003F9641F8